MSNPEHLKAIEGECHKQSDSCLYTSASLFIWLRDIRKRNFWLNAAPIVLGGVAAISSFVEASPEFTGLAAFVAGLLPSIYKKLGVTQHEEQIAHQAGLYKNLQDRFSQAATITSKEEDVEKLKMHFYELMDQMENLRSMPITPPEKYFLEAQAKIKKGHYDPD